MSSSETSKQAAISSEGGVNQDVTTSNVIGASLGSEANLGVSATDESTSIQDLASQFRLDFSEKTGLFSEPSIPIEQRKLTRAEILPAGQSFKVGEPVKTIDESDTPFKSTPATESILQLAARLRVDHPGIYRDDTGKTISTPHARELAQQAYKLSLEHPENSDYWLSQMARYEIGKDDLLTEEELLSVQDPSFWEHVGTILEPFLTPQRALWSAAWWAGDYLPDPGSAVGDIFQSTVGVVGGLALGTWVGVSEGLYSPIGFVGSLFSDDGEDRGSLKHNLEDPAKTMVNGFTDMARNFYDELATGRLSEASETHLRPWLWWDWSMMPSPTGEMVLDSFMTIEQAEKLSQTATMPHLKKYAEHLSTDTGRLAHGLLMELVFDPLWLSGAGKLGPIAKTGTTVITKGGQLGKVSKGYHLIKGTPLWKAGNTMEGMSATAGKVKWNDKAANLIRGTPAEVKESINLVNEFAVIAAQSATDSKSMLAMVEAAIKKGTNLSDDVKIIAEARMAKRAVRAEKFKRMDKVNSARGLVEDTVLVRKKIFKNAGDDAFAMKYLLREKKILSNELKVANRNTNALLDAIEKSAVARANGSERALAKLALPVGGFGWHVPLPFVYKGGYLLKKGPISGVTELLREVPFVSKAIDSYGFKALDSRVKAADPGMSIQQIFAGDKNAQFAYEIQKFTGKKLLIPMRIFDIVRTALGDKTWRPMTQWLEVERAKRYGTLATMPFGAKVISRIQQVDPQSWAKYVELVDNYIVQVQGLESILRPGMKRLITSAEKALKARRKAADGKVEKLEKAIDLARANGRGTAILEQELAAVKVWKDKTNYTYQSIIDEAGDAIDRGLGEWGGMSDEIQMAATEIQALKRTLLESSPEMAAIPERIDQALVSMVRHASGDPKRAAALEANIELLTQRIKHLDSKTEVWKRKLNLSMLNRRAQIESVRTAVASMDTLSFVKLIEKVKARTAGRAYTEAEDARYIHSLLLELTGTERAADRILRHMAIGMGEASGHKAVAKLAEEITGKLTYKGKRVKEPLVSLKDAVNKYLADLVDESRKLRKALNTGAKEGVHLHGEQFIPGIDNSNMKILINRMLKDNENSWKMLVPDDEWESFRKFVDGVDEMPIEPGPVPLSMKAAAPPSTAMGSKAVEDFLRSEPDVKSVLNWLENGPDEYSALIAARIKNHIPEDLTIRLVSSTDATESALTRGWFQLTDGKMAITLRDTSSSTHGMYETVIIHELLHAATSRQLEGAMQGIMGGPKFADLAGAALADDILVMWNAVQMRLLQSTYGGSLTKYERSAAFRAAISDPHEFVTWAFTDTGFQAYLKSMQVSDTGTPLMSLFEKNIAEFLRLTDKDTDMLRQIVSTTDRILDPAITAPTVGNLKLLSLQSRPTSNAVWNRARNFRERELALAKAIEMVDANDVAKIQDHIFELGAGYSRQESWRLAELFGYEGIEIAKRNIPGKKWIEGTFPPLKTQRIRTGRGKGGDDVVDAEVVDVFPEEFMGMVDDAKRIKESAGANIYPTYKAVKDDVLAMAKALKPKATKKELDALVKVQLKEWGFETKAKWLAYRSKRIDELVEEPVKHLVKKVLDEGHTPVQSNAYNAGEKGVWFTRSDGSEGFYRLSDNELKALFKEAKPTVEVDKLSKLKKGKGKPSPKRDPIILNDKDKAILITKTDSSLDLLKEKHSALSNSYAKWKKNLPDYLKGDVPGITRVKNSADKVLRLLARKQGQALDVKDMAIIDKYFEELRAYDNFHKQMSKDTAFVLPKDASKAVRDALKELRKQKKKVAPKDADTFHTLVIDSLSNVVAANHADLSRTVRTLHAAYEKRKLTWFPEVGTLAMEAGEAGGRLGRLTPDGLRLERLRNAFSDMTNDDVAGALKTLLAPDIKDEYMQRLLLEIAKKTQIPKRLTSPEIAKGESVALSLEKEFGKIKEEITGYLAPGSTVEGQLVRPGQITEKFLKEVEDAQQPLISANGAMTEKALKKMEDLQEKLKVVKPKFSEEALGTERLLEGWEAKLWGDVKEVFAKHKLSDEDKLFAAFGTLREANWFIPEELRRNIGKLYPSLLGRRFGDLDDTLMPVMEELESIIKFYEKQFKMRGYDWVASPQKMMENWGTVGYTPHLYKHMGELDETQVALGMVLSGSGRGVDQLFWSFMEASQTRRIAGSISEVNALKRMKGVKDADMISLDPVLIWSRYTQANHAMSNEHLLLSLMGGGIARVLRAEGGKSVEEIAKALDMIPLFIAPNRRRSIEILHRGSIEDWVNAGLVPGSATDMETIKKVQTLIESLAVPEGAFATFVNTSPKVRKMRQMEQLVLRVRGRQAMEGQELYNVTNRYDDLVTNPLNKLKDDWNKASVEELRAIVGKDGFSLDDIGILRENYISGKLAELDKVAWKTIANELNGLRNTLKVRAPTASPDFLKGLYAPDGNLWELYIPRQVVQHLQDYIEMDFKAYGPIGRFAQKANSWWKTRVTVTAIAFSVRNMLSNTMSNVLDLGPMGALNPRTNMQALKLSSAAMLFEEYGSLVKAAEQLSKTKRGRAAWKASGLQKYVDEGIEIRPEFLRKGKGEFYEIDWFLGQLVERGVVSPAYTAFVDVGAMESGLLQASLGRGKRSFAGVDLEDVFVTTIANSMGGTLVALPKKWGGEYLARTVENQARITNFLGNFRRSGSWTESVNHVHKFLFNYGDLSQFQKRTMRLIFPFFTWNQKNLLLHFELMQKSPAAYAAFHRMASDGFPQVLEATQAQARGERYVNSDPLAPEKLRQREVHTMHLVQLPFPSVKGTALENIPVPVPAKMGEGFLKMGTIGKDVFPYVKNAKLQGLGLPQEAFVNTLSEIGGIVTGLGDATIGVMLPESIRGRKAKAREYEDRKRAARILSETHFMARLGLEVMMGHHAFFDKPINELTDGRLINEALKPLDKIGPAGRVIKNYMYNKVGLKPYSVYDSNSEQWRDFIHVDGQANYLFSTLPWSRNLRDAAASTDMFFLSQTIPASKLADEGYTFDDIGAVPYSMAVLDAMSGISVKQLDPVLLQAYADYRHRKTREKYLESMGLIKKYSQSYVPYKFPRR